MKRLIYFFIYLFICFIGAFIHSYFNLGNYDYIFGFLIGSICMTFIRFAMEVE